MRSFPLASFLVAVGCSGESLPSPSAVRALRVVALVTDTPEVAPGESARVTAAWIDPTPGRAIEARWQLCAEADVGDPRSCPAAAEALDLGDGESITTPPLARIGVYFVLIAACVGGAPTLRRDLGHWRCADGGYAEEVFRRIAVTLAGPRNRPPGIAGWALTRGDAAVSLPLEGDAAVRLPPCDRAECGPWSLRVRPAEDAAETLPDGGREALSASFFVTSGSTDRPRDTASPGESREFAVRWTPAGASAAVWVVLRDQRGGETARGAAVTGSGR